MAVKSAHVLKSPAPVNATLCGNRDFAGIIKFRTLRWGDYPGSFRWPQGNPTVLMREPKRSDLGGKVV